MADYEARSNGVECPECGDPRTPVKISGFGDTGKRYRRRRCYSCRTLFTTIEVALPEEVPWGALCTSAREAQRRMKRAANGWQPRPKRYGRTADVDVKLKVRLLPGYTSSC